MPFRPRSVGGVPAGSVPNLEMCAQRTRGGRDRPRWRRCRERRQSRRHQGIRIRRGRDGRAASRVPGRRLVVPIGDDGPAVVSRCRASRRSRKAWTSPPRSGCASVARRLNARSTVGRSASIGTPSRQAAAACSGEGASSVRSTDDISLRPLRAQTEHGTALRGERMLGSSRCPRPGSPAAAGSGPRGTCRQSRSHTGCWPPGATRRRSTSRGRSAGRRRRVAAGRRPRAPAGGSFSNGPPRQRPRRRRLR